MQRTFKEPRLSRRATTIIAHVAGWLILLGMPLLFIANNPRQFATTPFYFNPWLALFVFSFAGYFYLHTYVLYPRLFLGRRKVFYFLALGLLIAAFLWGKPFDRLMSSREFHGDFDKNRKEMMPGPPRTGNMPAPPATGPGQPPQFEKGKVMNGGRRKRVDVVSVFLLLTLTTLGISVKSAQRANDIEKRALQAENDKANTELSFLKAQINPHFLFNTLNNIYALAITNSSNTADSIIKLSNIMRYVTDEVVENKVALKAEAGCISDYIDLQRLRLSDFTRVSYKESGNLQGKDIPPMILMTFVENAFKYGISTLQDAPIDISLEAGEANIVFTCHNRIFKSSDTSIASTGIGLTNTRKRLAHLYPDKHYLNIETVDGYYNVMLTLQV